MEKKHPEGVVVVKSTPVTPVMITRLRTVGSDKQTIEAQLEQMFEPPLVNSTSGVLSFFMEGHKSFQTGPRKRVAWQNMSTDMMIRLGLISKWEDVGESEAEVFNAAGESQGVVKGVLLPKDLELKVTRNGQIIPTKLIVVDTFLGRKWVDQNSLKERTQNPRTAGLGGDILTRGGRPIYRNTTLTMPGNIDVNLGREWDEDYIITHDNAIVGSTVRAAMTAAGMPIGAPNTPGGVNTPKADPAFQNKGIGETSNLAHGTEGSTRSTPDEQTQEVAEKTKAEEAREAGQRPVETQPQHE